MMAPAGQPPRDGCPSDLVLDRWVAGHHQPELVEHLPSCERCRARVNGFDAIRDAAAPGVAVLVARAHGSAGTRVRPRWLWGGGFAAAAAAGAVVLLLAVTGPLPVGIRAKGTSMRFVVQRDGRVFAGTSGDAFLAGDALRFLVSSGSRAHFLLVGIEESGRVLAYHPFDGSGSIEIEPGADLPLPGSLVLDNGRATEYFLGIFAEQPVTLEEVQAAVAEARGGGRISMATLRRLHLPGSHHWVVIRKE